MTETKWIIFEKKLYECENKKDLEKKYEELKSQGKEPFVVRGTEKKQTEETVKVWR